jgi:mono/diheme cytochrome c family protein
MKRPLRVSSLLMALLTFGGMSCGGGRSHAVSHATTEVDSTAVDSVGAVYSAARLPIPDLGYNAREGRVVYRHYCLNCHGDEGKGDGFNAYNLDPRPRALDDSTFQAQHSDSDLVAAIRSGGSAVGLSTGMPPWGRTLSERQIRNVVDYLRTLAAVEGAQP